MQEASWPRKSMPQGPTSEAPHLLKQIMQESRAGLEEAFSLALERDVKMAAHARCKCRKATKSMKMCNQSGAAAALMVLKQQKHVGSGSEYNFKMVDAAKDAASSFSQLKQPLELEEESPQLPQKCK
jgi:hypothetical protein